ncbi:MAG: 50S ribosomal protein L21 [Armatimonadota bacterium]
MYAIFEAGGRQFWAEPEQVLRIDRMDAEEGDVVEFDKVLALDDEEQKHIGQPYVDGATIKATVLEQGREKKITVFTYKQKKHTKRKKGHRQHFTAIRVDEIST